MRGTGHNPKVNRRGCSHFLPDIATKDGVEVTVHDKASPTAVLTLRVPDDALVSMGIEEWDSASAVLTLDEARSLRNLLDRFITKWSDGNTVRCVSFHQQPET